MLRNIQAVFRPFKGLNLTQKTHKLWVQYFTAQTAQSLTSVPKNSKINAHYSNFNFADINMKLLVAESEVIESNPNEALPMLLHFDQPISNHYFNFCKILLTSNAEQYQIINVVNESSVHLIRALLAFSFQLPRELLNFQQQKENVFFPFHYLTDFKDLVSVLLMTSGQTFSDFLYLLVPILDTLRSNYQPDSLIYEAAQNVFSTILEFIEDHKCEAPELKPIFTFLIDILYNCPDKEDAFIKFCEILVKNQSINQFITCNSYINLINIITRNLDKISNSELKNMDLFEKGISMIKVLIFTFDEEKQNFKIASNLLSFIDWVSKFNALPEMKLPEIVQKKITDNINPRVDYDFTDLDLFDDSVFDENPISLSSISPIYIELSDTILSLIKIISELCNKNEYVLEEIILTFPPKGIIYLYYAASIIYFCKPKNIGLIITRTEMWNYFLSKQIINEVTLLDKENVDPYILNLKDLVLSILLLPTDNLVSGALCSLLDPNYPLVVFKIVQLFNSISSDTFMRECANSPIFDSMMKSYILYRKYLTTHKDDSIDETIIFMKKAKSSILNFIKTLNNNEINKVNIFTNDRRVEFILSLLFEKKSFDSCLDLICKAFEQEKVGILIRNINQLFKVASNFLEKTDWQELILVIVDCLTVSISVNEKVLISSLIKNGSIGVFSKIPFAFANIKNGKTIGLTFLHKILRFFISIVHNTSHTLKCFSDPQWNFTSNMSNALKFLDITDVTIDLLLNFTQDGSTLIAKEGISLLFAAAEKTQFEEKIFDFLVKATNNSIVNRYQCFLANSISMLIPFFEKSPTATDFVLFKNICSSYFRVGELAQILKLLSEAQKDYAVHLINTLITINETHEDHNINYPKSFFHFISTSLFKIPPFKIPSSFTVSTKLFFPKKYTALKPIFTMSNKHDQVVIMNVINDRFILEVKNEGVENQFLLYTNVVPLNWIQFDLLIEKSKVSLFVNSKLETSSIIRNKFRFKGEVTFLIENIEVDIQYLKIISQENDFYSSFDASVVNENISLNLASNPSIKYGYFFGISVPFKITFIDAIHACGGSQIFLPLFQHAESKEFFKQFLILIQSLVIVDESIFDPQFFRSLGYMLTEVKEDFYNKDTIEEIFRIYKSMKSVSLQEGMLKHIFGNFNVWTRLRIEQQIQIYSEIFKNVLILKPDLFYNVFKFNDILMKFTIVFEKFQNNKELIDKSTNFLALMSQNHFTYNDAQSLVASAMCTTSNEMCLRSLFIITYLISNKSPNIINFLNQTGVFQPFISVLNSRYESTRIIAINCIYHIQSKINSKKFSLEIIDSIRVLNVIDLTPLTLINLMSCMTKSVEFKGFPYVIESYDFDTLKPIYYPEFLPLFSHLLTLVDETQKNSILKYFKDCICEYEESRISFNKSSFWILWLVFLGNLDNNLDEWLNIITNIIITNSNNHVTERINEFLFIGKIYKINVVPYVRNILKQAISKRPTINLGQFTLHFVFYLSTMNFGQKSIFDDAIHTFCQKFITSNAPKFICKFNSQIDNQNDLDLATAAVEAILNKCQQIQNNENQDSTSQIQHNNDPFYLLKSSSLCKLNFTFICYIIKLIATKNMYDGERLSKLLFKNLDFLLSSDLVSSSQNLRNNTSIAINNVSELSPGIIILYQFYYKDPENSSILLQFLKRIDPSYSHMSLERIHLQLLENEMEIIQKLNQEFESQMCNRTKYLDTSMNPHIAKCHKKLSKRISHIFDEENTQLSILRNLYSKSLYQIELDFERLPRRNAKYYKMIFKKMQIQNGGPWFSLSDKPHYKFDNITDSIWRHNKMAVRFHFNDHKDASTFRDSGSESVQQTIEIKGNVVEQDSEEIEIDERYNLELECQMITIDKFFKGTFYVTPSSIYFEAKETTDVFGEKLEQTSKLIEISNDSIKFILKRCYLLIDQAAEIFTIDNRSYFFVFNSEENRSNFFNVIKNMKPKNLEFIQFTSSLKILKDLKLVKKWCSGEISNYEYLYWINLLSGRSINDICQYPVFPWVIADYTNKEIDFSKESSFRDLQKPIGCLNETRLANLKELYNDTKTLDIACLYRFHYSAPAYVISFLLRNEPFTTLHIQLQNGKFDHPSRLFYSVKSLWDSITSTQNDFRELIPEFYATPEFLINSDKFDLGYRSEITPVNESNLNNEEASDNKDSNEVNNSSNVSIRRLSVSEKKDNIKYFREKGGGLFMEKQEKVDDVELPPWATSAAAYVAINRIALESPYVSAHLHEWIDLIFGSKQRSEKDNNLFHPYSYFSTLKKYPELKENIQQHAANLGVTPIQLFLYPHKPRKVLPKEHKLTSLSQLFFTSHNISSLNSQVLKISSSISKIYALFENGTFGSYEMNDKNQLSQQYSSLCQPAANQRLPQDRIFIDSKAQFVILSPPWSHGFIKIHKSSIFQPREPHSTAVTAIAYDSQFCVTGGGDSSLIVWDLENEIMQCYIVAHKESIKCVAISRVLELVVSCDIGGNVIFSHMKNGTFLRKMKFDSPPSKILISSLGFIIFVFSKAEEGAYSSTIILADMGGRILAEADFEGMTTATEIIENQDSTSYLCVAQETKIVYIVRAYDLKIVSMGPINGIVTDLTYCKDDLSLYLLLDDNTINLARFNI